MALKDWRIYKDLYQRLPQPAGIRSGKAARRPRTSKRSRTSIDRAGDGFVSMTQFVEAPTRPDELWRVNDLDTQTLGAMSTSRLIELLADLSPEVSRALWDFLRFMNPGHELRALQMNGDEVDATGQAALDELVALLDGLYGSFDVVVNSMLLGGFLRGAFFAELVLDDAGRVPVDLVTPDPATARFKRRLDPIRGQVWQLGQYQNSQFVALESPTVRYVPIDKLPAGAPYGRPPIAPAVFSSLFLLGILHDLKRVVQQQGWPRIDIAVMTDALLESMPDSLDDNPEEVKKWIDDTIDEVQDVYASLEPDDAYVHTDAVEVNQPVGAVDSRSLGYVDTLIRALERMLVRGLKTMPLMFGLNEGASETHANRQWEIHVAGIKALQHLAEGLLEHLFKVALRAQGIQSRVEFRFAQLRASEEYRDAQAEAARIANERAKYEAGWISQNEAAEAITGSKADVPAPRVGSSGGSAEPIGLPEEGRQLDVIVAARKVVAEHIDRLAGVSLNGTH